MKKIYYLTYVVGERGVGKTTLLAHFATEYMIPPRAISDLLLCKQEIARLRAGGWDNLSLAPHVQHLVYVVDDTFIARGLKKSGCMTAFTKFAIYCRMRKSFCPKFKAN